MQFYIFHRYEKPVETAQDIIDKDLTVQAFNNSYGQSMLKDSSLPILRKLYKENVLAKNGVHKDIMPPKRLEDLFNKGLAVSASPRRYRVLDGNLMHYAKNSISLVHSGFVFPKNHWLKVNIIW